MRLISLCLLGVGCAYPSAAHNITLAVMVLLALDLVTVDDG